MNFRTCYVIFTLSLISCNQLIGKGSLIKQHTIVLPSTPSIFKFNSTESNLSLNRPAFGFYCVLVDEQQNNILQQHTLNNNPKNIHITSRASLITEFAVLNKDQEQNNPLFNTELEHVSLGWRVPVIVTHEEPNKVYLVESMLSSTQQNLLASEQLCDAQGHPSAGIIGLSLGSTSTLEQHILNEYIFAAVKGSDGVWGTKDSSGIAVISHARDRKEVIIVDENGKEKKETKVDRFLRTLDATTGEVGGNKAVALDAAAISINGGTSCINPQVVDLYWSPLVERLYVALQIKNSSDCTSTQGSRAILVGRIDTEQRLVFDPIVDDKFCQGVDKIVGATGPDVALSLHKVRTLVTSTGYTYLITVGGVGEPHETDRDVYALPLTSKAVDSLGSIHMRAEIMNDPIHGVIASKSCKHYMILAQTSRGPKVSSRILPEMSSHDDDCYTKHDKEAVVGAGKKLPSPITDVVTLTDVVYVTCAEIGEGQHPGMFHSQAILGVDGKVAAWTPWQRVAGIQDGVAQAMIMSDNYFIVYLKAHSPEVVYNVTADSRTRVDTQSDCTELLNKIFVKEQGGVYGLIDIPASSSICGNADVSFLIATGYKKIAFVETGARNHDGIFTAFKESYTENVVDVHDGVIEPFKPIDDAHPCSMVIEGGVLDDIGAITDAVVVNDSCQSWIVIGGKGGVAILAADDGSGVLNERGIRPHFAGITTGYSFKKFGEQIGIRRLWADEQFLYILTQRTLERFEINKDFVVMDHCLQKGTILAQLAPNEGSFFDVGVSGPLCILAGSKGLFVNASGSDCRACENLLALNTIELPYAKGNVYKLFFVSSTDQKNGFGHGGQVFVSTGSLAENMSRVYRLYIDDVFKNGVLAESVRLVFDMVYPKFGMSPFLVLNNFRDHFATDGVHHFSARSRQTRDNPFVKLVSLPILNEARASDPSSYDIPIHMGKKCAKISAIVQNSATGNWLFAGDFGLALHN